MNMRALFTMSLAVLLALFVTAGWASARGQAAPNVVPLQALGGTAFTFQGHLKDASGPVNASCDLQFALYDSDTTGVQVGGLVTSSAVPSLTGCSRYY